MRIAKSSNFYFMGFVSAQYSTDGFHRFAYMHKLRTDHALVTLCLCCFYNGRIVVFRLYQNCVCVCSTISCVLY